MTVLLGTIAPCWQLKGCILFLSLRCLLKLGWKTQNKKTKQHPFLFPCAGSCATHASILAGTSLKSCCRRRRFCYKSLLDSGVFFFLLRFSAMTRRRSSFTLNLLRTLRQLCATCCCKPQTGSEVELQRFNAARDANVVSLGGINRSMWTAGVHTRAHTHDHNNETLWGLRLFFYRVGFFGH